jgi:hypothetical protein
MVEGSPGRGLKLAMGVVTLGVVVCVGVGSTSAYVLAGVLLVLLGVAYALGAGQIEAVDHASRIRVLGDRWTKRLDPGSGGRARAVQWRIFGVLTMVAGVVLAVWAVIR